MLPNRDLADTIIAQAVTQPTPEEQARAERLAVLENLRITTATNVEAEHYALSVDGVGFFALDDIHALKGKQKAGKSAALKICAAALLSGQQFRVKSELEEPVVLFIDTEQQAADVKLIVDELKQLTHCNDEYIDSHLLLFPLRRMSSEILLSDTRLLIQTYRPQVVFIDGLVDYATRCQQWLQRGWPVVDIAVFTGDEIEDYKRLISISGEAGAQTTIKRILHDKFKNLTRQAKRKRSTTRQPHPAARCR